MATFDTDQSLHVEERELTTLAAPLWRLQPMTTTIRFRFVSDPRVIPTDPTTLMHPSILRRLMVDQHKHWIQQCRDARWVVVPIALQRIPDPFIEFRVTFQLVIHPHLQDPRPRAGLDQLETLVHLQPRHVALARPFFDVYNTWVQRVGTWPTQNHATPMWSLGQACLELGDDADVAVQRIMTSQPLTWGELRSNTQLYPIQWHILSVMARRESRCVSSSTTLAWPTSEGAITMSPLVPGSMPDLAGCRQRGAVWSAPTPSRRGGILCLHRGMGTTWLTLLHVWHLHPKRAWIVCPARRIQSWQRAHRDLFRTWKLGFPEDPTPWHLVSYEWIASLSTESKARWNDKVGGCIVADAIDEASATALTWLLRLATDAPRWVVGTAPTRFVPWVHMLHWIGVVGADQPSLLASAQVADTWCTPLSLDQLDVAQDPSHLPELPRLDEPVRATQTRTQTRTRTRTQPQPQTPKEPWRATLETLVLVHAAMQHVVVRYRVSDTVRKGWWTPPPVLGTDTTLPTLETSTMWAWLARLRVLAWRAAKRSGTVHIHTPRMFHRIVEQGKAEAGEIPMPLVRLRAWKQREQVEWRWRKQYVAPSDLKPFAGEACMICTEPYMEPRILGCAHVFCRGCIRQWFKNARTCPACKRIHPKRSRLIRVHNADYAEDDRWLAKSVDAYRTIPTEAQSMSNIREERIDALVEWVEAHPKPTVVVAYYATLLRDADLALSLVPGHRVTLRRFDEVDTLRGVAYVYLLQAPRSPRVWWQLQRAVCMKQHDGKPPMVMHGYPAWAATEWKLARLTHDVWTTLRSYALQWDDAGWKGWMDALMQRDAWWTLREVERWYQL